ncbi:tail fiber assembly protein [Xenorhabdus stockiae]
MYNLTNFKSYQPENPKFGDCSYIQSDEGVDWYDARKLLSPDTLKVVYDTNGVIIDYNTDASMLYPNGFSVIEMDKKHAPAGLNYHGDWQYDGKAIIQRVYTPEELQKMAVHRKQQELLLAMHKIAPLQDAIDLDMATKEEKAELLKWKKYRVLLNRVDCSTAPDIVWPEQPE